MCKMTFDDRINCEYYYNNCMYNCGKAKQVLVFVADNMTAKLGMIYTDKTK